jgi:hypothetical protein
MGPGSAAVAGACCKKWNSSGLSRRRKNTRSRLATVSLVCAMLALPVLPAHSQNLQQEYDLAKEAGSAVDAVDMRVFGDIAELKLGRSAMAADIDGDGADDLIVAAGASASPLGRSAAGAVHVWFGGAAFGGEIDLATTQADLTIAGASADDRLTLHPSPM